jgi:phenylacetate-CoA ligase
MKARTAMGTSTARKLYGNAVVAALLPGQRRVPFLPREKIEAIRDRRVRGIVSYAAKTVPHYRELFAREGIDPREIRSAADLDRLPLLDKAQLRAEPERFVAEARRARGAVLFTTSGSTGTPTKIFQDRRMLLANLAFGEREREPMIRLCGGSLRPKELHVSNERSAMKTVTAFYEANTLLPVRPRRRFVSPLDPIEEIAARMNAERPDILSAWGAFIGLFFKTVSARGIELHPPKLATYGGETLPPGAREQIEGEFGVPVLSRYTAAEAFKIGFMCDRRTGFHLNEDLCHVRIVGRDGEAVATGAEGEVVISNLYNRATVLLNYRLGDVAAMSDETCPCGRTLKLMTELQGRLEDILTLPGGRFVHPRAVWGALNANPHILQYQLVQHEPRRFELKLATVDEQAFESGRELAVAELERVLGPDATIAASRRGKLDDGGRGKFRPVVALGSVDEPSPRA